MRRIPEPAAAIDERKLIPAPTGAVAGKERPRRDALETPAVEAVQLLRPGHDQESSAGGIEERRRPIPLETVGLAEGDESRGPEPGEPPTFGAEPERPLVVFEHGHLRPFGEALRDPDRAHAAGAEVGHARARADPYPPLLSLAIAATVRLDHVEEIVREAGRRVVEEHLARRPRHLAREGRGPRARVERPAVGRVTGPGLCRERCRRNREETARPADPEPLTGVHRQHRGAGDRSPDFEASEGAVGTAQQQRLPGRDPQVAVAPRGQPFDVALRDRQRDRPQASLAGGPGVEAEETLASDPEDAGGVEEQAVGCGDPVRQRLDDERPRGRVGFGREAGEAARRGHPDGAVRTLGHVVNPRARQTLRALVVAEDLTVEARQAGARRDPEEAARIAEEVLHRVARESVRGVVELHRQTLRARREGEHEAQGGEKPRPAQGPVRGHHAAGQRTVPHGPQASPSTARVTRSPDISCMLSTALAPEATWK